METITASQPTVFTKEFRNACTDVLSQAINGEIVGMSNFANLTGTVDDVHERMECIEHANCERNHAEGFMQVAKKYNMPVVITLGGTYWTRVRDTFAKWSGKKDLSHVLLCRK